MLKLQATKRLRNYGLSAVAAGFVFFAGPIAADASDGDGSDFGSKLLTDGIENSHVEKLQDLLVTEGYLQESDANGVYDEATTNAVTNYQEEQQLLVDGMAGVQTLGALKVLGKGAENELVADLQGTLQDTGYYNGSVDGYYDVDTHDSVKSFQSDADIAVDGLAGPETFGALYYGISEAVEEDTEEGEAAEEAEATEEDEDAVEEEAEATEEDDDAVEEETEATEEDDDAVEEETEATEEDDDAVEEETEATEEDEDAVEEEAEATEEDDDAVEEEAEATEEDEDAVEEEAEATEEDDDAVEEEAEATEDDEGSDAEGETYTMEATAYTADCEGCSGVTAEGTDLNNNRDANVVAVDPEVIELGSTVHVEGYGEAVADDVGGDINGERIDLHMATQEEAEQFGVQDVEVTVLD